MSIKEQLAELRHGEISDAFEAANERRNITLDTSGGSVFRILIDTAMLD